MSLDHIIHEAVKNAVEGAGQSKSVSDKIIAWITGLSNGNESLDDTDNSHRRARLLYEDTILPEDTEAE